MAYYDCYKVLIKNFTQLAQFLPMTADSKYPTLLLSQLQDTLLRIESHKSLFSTTLQNHGWLLEFLEGLVQEASPLVEKAKRAGAQGTTNMALWNSTPISQKSDNGSSPDSSIYLSANSPNLNSETASDFATKRGRKSTLNDTKSQGQDFEIKRSITPKVKEESTESEDLHFSLSASRKAHRAESHATEVARLSRKKRPSSSNEDDFIGNDTEDSARSNSGSDDDLPRRKSARLVGQSPKNYNYMNFMESELVQKSPNGAVPETIQPANVLPAKSTNTPPLGPVHGTATHLSEKTTLDEDWNHHRTIPVFDSKSAGPPDIQRVDSNPAKATSSHSGSSPEVLEQKVLQTQKDNVPQQEPKPKQNADDFFEDDVDIWNKPNVREEFYAVDDELDSNWRSNARKPNKVSKAPVGKKGPALPNIEHLLSKFDSEKDKLRDKSNNKNSTFQPRPTVITREAFLVRKTLPRYENVAAVAPVAPVAHVAPVAAMPIAKKPFRKHHIRTNENISAQSLISHGSLPYADDFFLPRDQYKGNEHDDGKAASKPRRPKPKPKQHKHGSGKRPGPAPAKSDKSAAATADEDSDDEPITTAVHRRHPSEGATQEARNDVNQKTVIEMFGVQKK